jgi:hypothetical protein
MNKHSSLSLIDLATVIGGTTNNRINATVANRQRATIIGNGNLHESQVVQEMNNTFIQEEQQVNQTIDVNQNSFLI